MVDLDSPFLVLAVLFLSFAAVPAAPFLAWLYGRWRDSVARDTLRLHVSVWCGRLRRFTSRSDPFRDQRMHVNARHAAGRIAGRQCPTAPRWSPLADSRGYPMSDPLAFVRFRSGVVVESRRKVHLVRLPPILGAPAGIGEYAYVLTALCGQEFSPGEAELLPGMAGMPCENCLRLSPDPDETENVKSNGRPNGVISHPPSTDMFRMSAW